MVVKFISSTRIFLGLLIVSPPTSHLACSPLQPQPKAEVREDAKPWELQSSR
jgi:hypothetical protein